MKIIIRDYPSTFSFDTEEKLPKFQFGCHVRTKTNIIQIHYEFINTCNNEENADERKTRSVK